MTSTDVSSLVKTEPLSPLRESKPIVNSIVLKRDRSTSSPSPDKKRMRIPAVPKIEDDEFRTYIQVLLSLALDRQFLRKIPSHTELDPNKMRALEVVDEKNSKLMQYIKEKGKLIDEITEICQNYTIRAQIAVKVGTKETDSTKFNNKCMQCRLTSDSRSSSVRYKYIFEGFQYDKKTLLYKDDDPSRPMCQVIPICSIHAKLVEQYFVLSHLRHNVFLRCCEKIATLKCLHKDFPDDKLLDKAFSDDIWMSSIKSEYLRIYKRVESERD